jgi:D-serine deaminase-like pyridoxal phosphate-dependent protein
VHARAERRVKIGELTTPAAIADAGALDHNLRTMSAALPGPRLRPHIKAHKCTSLARRQAALGHETFTCATVREVLGMAEAGLGADLLLANEVLDARALGKANARVTVAVDSEATIEAAAAGGVREVLIDVNIGLPRCGCAPEDAGRLADLARKRGLGVRGVMGYEGHLMMVEDRADQAKRVDQAMELLARLATEIQAGSYALMDTQYLKLGQPFRLSLAILATVISVSPGYAVADCGLKSMSMDHGNPTIDGAKVWFCSDEHITFAPERKLRVGERIRVWPAHVDPTVAVHDRLHVVDGDDVLESWPVDLRGW